MFDFDKMLDELYQLVLLEEIRELTQQEKKLYVDYVDTLKKYDIEISFGVEI